MSELAHRRPQSVADAQTVDYTKALNYLGLSPGQPAAQALILVCQRYQLDPLLGHISLYDGKPYVHFSGYLHIANAHPEFEGIECLREWETDTHFLATVRVHRNDRSYPAERTGRSLKVKPKKGGGSYVDDHADAKAFAQAARRALRMAFNVDHPDPVDDHGGEAPTPEPVVEVARMVDEMSGAGEREPTISPDSRDLRHDPAPDPTSDPWGLSPWDHGSDPTSGGGEAAGQRHAGTTTAERPSPDLTSPPVGHPGKVAGGGDSNPPEPSLEDGDALPDDEGGGSDVSRGTADTRAAVEHATTDPTPPADPSPVQAWCERNKIDIRIARTFLRRSHSREFPDMRDRRDLEELRGERADKAVAYLDAQYLTADIREGD